MKKLGIIFVLFLIFCSCPSAKNLLNTSYSELGITLGTPCGLNLAAGNWHGRFGIKATGMFYAPGVYGLQTTLGFKLSDSHKIRHGVGLAFGSMQLEYTDWMSAGIVYNMNVKGFFFEAGLAVGRFTEESFYIHGDYFYSCSSSSTSPHLLLQIGYIHRLLPEVGVN